MKKKLILALVLIILSLLVYVNIQMVCNFAGRFIYPLDDAYIHLSMAKNFAEFGTWGITQYEFSSTTSSPLYTFLLAVLIKVFGNWEYIPLVINGLAGVAMLYVFHLYLRPFSWMTHAIVLGAVLLLMPLQLMIMIGMEHVCHALVMVLTLLAFRRYLEDKTPRRFSNLALVAIVAVGFRYESLFIILFICIYLFFIRRDYVISIALGILALLPVLVYGYISVDNGSFFLPNSLILKGNNSAGISGFLERVAGNLTRALSVLFLFSILVYRFFSGSKTSSGFPSKMKSNPVAFVVIGGFIGHLLFANFGWLIRYEAYLVVVVIFALIPMVEELVTRKSSSTLLKYGVVMMVLFTFILRFVMHIRKQSLASKNIFDQQIQMADFLRKNYNDAWVIANDIGAITYFTNIHLFDTYGLGTAEVAKLRKDDHGSFGVNKKLTDYIQKSTADYDIAVVYDSWVKLPDGLSKAGSWTIKDNYICGSPTVSFYSIRKANLPELERNLTMFRSAMPKDITIKINKR